MFKVRLVAVGILKKGPEFDLYHMYAKRLKDRIQLIEIKTSEEFSKYFPCKNYVIACDESGEMLSTMEFYEILCLHSPVTLLVGGADGFPAGLVVQKKISFGRMTWPHLLVRALLVEQVYRCQQIFLGHPYHRV